MDEHKQELLEIYKLHAKLADNVSQRREGANRFYVTLLTGVLMLSATFLRFGAETIPLGILLGVSGILMVFLSGSWCVVIHSYRQLNSGKFKTLHELEEKLAYSFFRREWELLGQGKDYSRYWILTVVETILPLGFLVFGIFLGLSAFLVECF